jgi:hypothetical protein
MGGICVGGPAGRQTDRHILERRKEIDRDTERQS